MTVIICITIVSVARIITGAYKHGYEDESERED
jgi:hypothetical protein